MNEWVMWPDDEFEAKLRRARHENQPIYLLRRAVGLLAREDVSTARELLGRGLVSAPERSSYRNDILSTLAELEIKQGNAGEAERTYRRMLAEDPGEGGADGAAEVYLAELLLDRGEVGEAEELLETWVERELEDSWEVQVFRYSACKARAFLAKGQGAGAAIWAQHALDIATRPDPLPRHPGVGAADPSDELRDWLTRLAERPGSPST